MQQIDLLNSVINSQAIEIHILRRQLIETQRATGGLQAENETLRKAPEPDVFPTEAA